MAHRPLRRAVLVALLFATGAPVTTAQGGWQPLLDGDDLDGWEVVLGPPHSELRHLADEPVFRMLRVDGEPVLRVDGHRWGALVSPRDLGDYHLRAWFRWGGEHWPPLDFRDGGVLYHGTGPPRVAVSGHATPWGQPAEPGPLVAEGKGTFMESLEYQIVADLENAASGPRRRLVGDFVWFGPSVGDLRERIHLPQREQGAWNLLEIVCRGTDVWHYLNGELVARITGTRRLLPEGPVPLRRGRLQFQSEGDRVEYRRIAIRALDDEAAPAVDDAPTPWAIRHATLRSRLETAREAGDWEGVVDACRGIEDLDPLEGVLPAFDRQARLQRAEAFARLGRDEDALELLGRTVNYGLVDRELIAGRPAFAGLLGRPAMDQVLDVAESYSRAPVLVYAPYTVDPGQPAPLLFVFHGRGDNPWGFFHGWGRGATEVGAILLAPRGPRHEHRAHAGGDRLRYTWDDAQALDVRAQSPARPVNLTAARRLVDEGLARAARSAMPDESRILLAGYGQGGAVALSLLLSAPDRYVGALALGTDPRDLAIEVAGDIAEDIAGDARLGTARRAVLLFGEHDPARDVLGPLHERLERAGIEVRTIDLPGLGHEQPSDHVATLVEGRDVISSSPHVARQAEALRYLLGED